MAVPALLLAAESPPTLGGTWIPGHFRVHKAHLGLEQSATMPVSRDTLVIRCHGVTLVPRQNGYTQEAVLRRTAALHCTPVMVLQTPLLVDRLPLVHTACSVVHKDSLACPLPLARILGGCIWVGVQQCTAEQPTIQTQML